MLRLLALCLLLVLPVVSAQTPGIVQSYVGLPHAVELVIGYNEVSMRIGAFLACEEGKAPPVPLALRLLDGGSGPNDGNGPAWTFAQSSWNLTWTQMDGNYSIDDTITFPVQAEGYGAAGRGAEFTIGITAATIPDACTTNGYTVPARSGHAHIQVPARPAPAPSEGAASPAVGLILAGLALVAWRRR